MPLPVNCDPDIETIPPQKQGMVNFADMGYAPSERLQRVKALYGGSISLIDKGVGRILRALDELGLTENTLVVFTSDHGEMLGDHGLWQKNCPFDASARVPMLARLPGRFAAGAVNEDLLSLLDFMPTMLELAEVDYPGQPALAGDSLLGAEGGGLAQKPEDQVVEIGRGAGRWLSLRGRRWKYNYWMVDGWEELYDLENDPQELSNLLLENLNAGDRQLADTMKAKLTAWETSYGFEDSLDENGALKNFGHLPTDHTEMRTNSQFPRWVPRLPNDERAVMESQRRDGAQRNSKGRYVHP